MKPAWVAVAFVFGCVGSERNPLFCGDGICVDPERPFCDVDASFSEDPGTCVAVSCTPRAFERCRGDTALTCNGGGNNFDLVECPLGCAESAAGCRQCIDNAQCDGSQVCDPITNACRACVADDECSSRVCDVDAKRCIDEREVVYATGETSGSNGDCTLTSPCSFAKAAGRALGHAPALLVRMLPGAYGAIALDSLTDQTLHVIATGAQFVSGGSVAALTVDRGAKLAIRGFTTLTDGDHVRCGSDNAATQSRLDLRDVVLRSSLHGVTAIEARRCALSMTNVGMTKAGTWFVSASSVAADRVMLQEGANTSLAMVGTSSVRIQNSVLENQRVFLFGLGELILSHTTLVYPGNTAIEDVCSKARVAGMLVLVENSILRAGAGDALVNPLPNGACTFSNTLLSQQASPPPGTFVGDPKFVDFGNHDYHLQAGSPAVDVGVPGMLTTDHDFDGTPRPQGAKPDLGAFELAP
ncbi:MAG: hypothetical protein KF773_10340 [Deltaproteobacteria bacterium]|nr:hypothetical protein [Deltaproteobacteria bacterium]